MGSRHLNILHVVGVRPNFMKAAPVMRALASRPTKQTLIHTGQHYDFQMSRIFFEELGLPKPDVSLGVGSGSHACQTGEIMKRIEPVMEREHPDIVLVYGDVNSTLAAALVACKLHIPVGHVEAGLRSFDRTMPEEINRVLTDQVSDLLFTHSPEANDNLRKEGIADERIHFVGNVMIDTLIGLLPVARTRNVMEELGLVDGTGKAKPYVLVTLHRPSNVDGAQSLKKILNSLEAISRKWPVVLPAHPRTQQRMSAFGIELNSPDLRIIEPVSYLDFLCLEERALAVVTDSGGVQEETTYLGVPCFTVRNNTERPVTITAGTNRLVGDDIEKLPIFVRDCLDCSHSRRDPPEHWDGKAAERISDMISSRYA